MAAWPINGVASAGDELVIDVREQGKPIGTARFQVGKQADASQLVLVAAQGLDRQLPDVYKPRGAPTSPSGPVLLLTLEPSEMSRRPRATLSIHRVASSTLSSPLLGKPMSFSDPTMSSCAMAWLKLSRGDAKKTLRHRLDPAKLTEGRHWLRAVAQSGSISASSQSIEWPIVTHATSARLTITPLHSKVPLGSGPIALAKATRSGLKPTRVDYDIFGGFAGSGEGDESTLTLDPSAWGTGAIRLSAVTYDEQGKTVRADSDAWIEVTP